MNDRLRQSYRMCERITRRAASNFYWSLISLGRPKRQAMYALYAFSRISDDITDGNHAAADLPPAGLALDAPAHDSQNSADPAALLARWRRGFDQALLGQTQHPVLLAISDVVCRYEIPARHLYDVLDGVAMDLQPRTYEAFAELETYCHRVASAVGMACLHIWGFQRHGQVEPLARKCGLAFQLTNILRDLKEDAQRQRIYLPREELARFNYPAESLRQGVVDERFVELMRFQTARAERLFCESAELANYLDDDGRRVFRLMHRTYFRLLREIMRRNGDVFSSRVRLGLAQRLQLAAGYWW